MCQAPHLWQSGKLARAAIVFQLNTLLVTVRSSNLMHKLHQFSKTLTKIAAASMLLDYLHDFISMFVVVIV